jgi:alkylation response protein AidB-like acyl-CoA dehydrogenase
MHHFKFDPVQLPPTCESLRAAVREFLAREQAAGTFTPAPDAWSAWNPDFSRRCGAAGFIGLTLPEAYGGHGRSALEKFVVTEEMLAGGAPVFAHWIADRQSSMQILHHGSDRARREILPRIARGECFFGIGMSEPDSGSDLAAVRTRATRVEGGWSITGTKIWTSNAHRAHYLLALVRTEPRSEERHLGLTQFIVDLSRPGVAVRPIRNLYGGHDFNEVNFEGYFVEDDMVIGKVGEGWKMVTGELAYERAGPDRYLSAYALLLAAIRAAGSTPGERSAHEIGRLVAHLAGLRRMSSSIAGMLDRGEQPMVEAALLKDMGTTFEREIPEVVRTLFPLEPSLLREEALSAAHGLDDMLGDTVLRAPGFTLRGGTREILRGMIARGLGLR